MGLGKGRENRIEKSLCHASHFNRHKILSLHSSGFKALSLMIFLIPYPQDVFLYFFFASVGSCRTFRPPFCVHPHHVTIPQMLFFFNKEHKNEIYKIDTEIGSEHTKLHSDREDEKK